ncbi:MAG TPA: hypothetical protein VIX59_05800 [Candidatus Binataceae bacterium]
MPPRSTDSVDPARRPEVIVDFASSDGMLFVILKNIGMRSAYRVTTRFDKPIRGLEGRKRISEMRLFGRLEFLPPGKEFSQFIDPVAVYLKRREPTRFAITVTYADREGHRFKEVIRHDLRVFSDLGYIRK